MVTVMQDMASLGEGGIQRIKRLPHISQMEPQIRYQALFRPHFEGAPDRDLEKSLSFHAGFVEAS